MILLVGLGNPGAKYARNRHNAGFMAIDAIAEAQGFPAWRKKFNGHVTDTIIQTDDGPAKVLLLKPETFYNETGNAVAAAARFYNITPDQIVVFHDEIDLAPAKLRVKKGGGLAGNNGLRSTAAHMGPDFWRVRIGIGHPGRKDAVTPWVLGDFSKAEQQDYLDEMLSRLGRAIPHLLALNETAAGRFMSAIVQPPSGEAGPRPAKPASAPAPEISPAKSEKTSPFDALKNLIGKGD
ncbi:aminoacyl-tRNA hydrolase [Parvularcula sp. LCG005]|uniref:aminoacyl-tRNA hydrolase n=1 Tax=Parvularcula sp. LCG005 TaxID=3078805 RepID=UPI00294317FD|nr:aminoacyl-tRNA hydrolase [Parvularcula sp. LCG005]WOI54437.1 aminoacyl-tRNA hydrolase [Parvularcula sp. LCG005]